MNIQSNIPATSLCQRMIEDMVARNLGRHSRRNHLASCKRLAAFLERSPDTATADDMRRKKRSPPTRRNDTIPSRSAGWRKPRSTWSPP